MALKPCKECKKSISGDANPCPHCGKKNPHGMSKLMKYGGGAVLAVIVLAIAAPAAKTAKGTSNSSPVEASQGRSPALAVDAVKLWQDYEANEVAADGTYKGKILQVTGIVSSIDKDFMDNVVLRLKSPNPIMGTMARLEKSESGKAAGLSKGAAITLICEGRGRVVGSPSLHW
jgi:hypothetical protein